MRRRRTESTGARPVARTGYRSGHMMYLRLEDLETSSQDIQEFIAQSTPVEGQPATYGRAAPRG